MSSKKQKSKTDKSVAPTTTTKVEKSIAPKPKRTQVEKPAKATKKTSIRTIVREAFIANPAISNEDVVAAVKKARPDSAFGDKQAQWYRWMAKKGILTGSAIAMPRKTRKKAVAATA